MFGKNRRRTLGFETLERREVFAGNVTAALDPTNNLVISGDALAIDKAVAVYRSGANVTLTGGRTGADIGSSTTVNGNAGPVTFIAPSGIVLNMGAGNDLVVFTNGAFVGGIGGNLGNGNDRVAIQGVGGPVAFTRNDGTALPLGAVSVAQSVFINGNAGNDTLSMYNATVGANVTYRGNDGNDTFSQDGTSHALNIVGGTLAIQPNAGDIAVNVRRLAVGIDFRIDSEAATTNSTITLTNLRTSRDTVLNLSLMPDTVNIAGEDTTTNRFQARNLTVNTGDSPDRLTIDRGIMTNLTAATGAGDEGNGVVGITMTNLTIGTSFFVNSGTGFDNLSLRGISARNFGVYNEGTEADGVIASFITATFAVYTLAGGLDVVGLYDSNYAQTLSVILGDANDSLYAGNVTVQVAATFNGGNGDDVYFSVGGNSFTSLTRISI